MSKVYVTEILVLLKDAALSLTGISKLTK